MADTPAQPQPQQKPQASTPAAAASQPEEKAVPEEKNVPLQPTQSPATMQRLDQLEKAIEQLAAGQAAQLDAAPEPTDLELSMSYAKDEKATEALGADEAFSMLKRGLPEDEAEALEMKDLMDFAVRGPYLVATTVHNGDKIAVEHDMSASMAPRVGQPGKFEKAVREQEQVA